MESINVMFKDTYILAKNVGALNIAKKTSVSLL